jgi:phage gp36-like protein
MRYCTREDILRKVPARTLAQLTNDTPPATEPNWECIDEIAVGVEERMDAAIRQRHTLPLLEVPTVVRDIAVQMIRYECYDRRPEGKLDLPPAVVRGQKWAEQQLSDIRSGTLTLGQAGDPAAVQPAGAPVKVRAPKKRVTDGLLDKY